MSMNQSATGTEPFYFYREVGQPMNISASNLDEFVTKIKSVDIQSLEFHNRRGDFEKWVRSLGNNNLAEQLASVRAQNPKGEQLRIRLTQTLSSKPSSTPTDSGASGKSRKNRS